MQSTLEPTNDYTNPSQPEVTSNNQSTNEWTQNTNNDLMDDIITSNEMKVNDQQIINNYQQQQTSATTTTTTTTTQTFVDSNVETTDNNNNNNNNNNEQIDKIEQVQQQQPMDQGINGFHNDNVNDNNNDSQQQQQQQQVQVDIMDNAKEEEEENEQTQVTQQEILDQDDMSKDISIKTASESVESAPSQSQNVENVQNNNNLINTKQQQRAPNSWAAFLKGGKPVNASPKRRAMAVYDHVSDKLGSKGKGQGSVQSKIPRVIRTIIDGAIKNKSIIWISYNGHQKPFIPRAVKPIQWDKNSNKGTFFAVQHRSKSQNQQRFFLKYVVEVRDKQWRISNSELEALKRSGSNPQWTENGPQRNSQRNSRNSNNKRGGGGGSGQRGAYANNQQQQGQ